MSRVYMYTYYTYCQHHNDFAWGCTHSETLDAEIQDPSVENPVLTNVLHLKSGVGQNIAMHASPTARNFSLS